MPRVSCLGVGGGLNHLCEVEVPEKFAEFIGGRLNGVLMWLPMGQDICLVIRFCVGKRDEVAAVPSAGPEESGCASDLSCGSCRGEAAP